MKKFLTIFGFVFLLFAFASPARAAVWCPDGGVVSDPTLPEIWQCCNYENSPNHIRADTPDCNSTHCQMQNFPKNEDSNTYGGVCRYCNTNVTVRIDGCSGCGCTCNQVCAAGGPPDGDDEDDCYMPDDNLTACCPVTGNAAGFLGKIWEFIEKFIGSRLPVALKVTDFKASKKFEEATDYYFGKTKTNGSGEEEIEEGVFFRLAPPNLLEEQFPNDGDEVGKRKDWAKWLVGSEKTSGDDTTDALNDGKLKNVEPYRHAVENLRNFLVAIPKTEDNPTSQKIPEIKVAKSNPDALVLAASTPTPTPPPADNLCLPPVVEAETKETCTPDDTPEGSVKPSDFFDLLIGTFKLFPKIADLDKIGHYTAGVETDPSGGAAKDLHYEDGGFLEIFKLPTEQYEDRNAKGSADLKLTLKPFGMGIIDIPLGEQELEFSHEGADSHEREKENGVYAKLSVPQAEDSTTTYQAPSEPTIYLASNPTVQGTAHYPQNISLAEKIGRGLGSWLGKLITL